MMKRILILMSTYNGEKYLREQLDSIVAQQDVEITVLVRDDGSKDSTLMILNEYRETYPLIFVIEKGENIGCRMSFFWLIKEAADSYPDYDYYAFADQDDVWYTDKLISGVRQLDNIDNPYKVYYCAYQMVDENLKIISTKQYESKGTIGESFILQPCIGCSMLVSPQLIKKAALANPVECSIHDAWTYQLNLALGGMIIQDRTIHMLYRQHSSNTIGSHQSFKSKWKRRIKSFSENQCTRSKQAKEIIRVYKKEIPKSIFECINIISEYKNSFRQKITIITSQKFKSNKTIHNLLFQIAILTNRI